MINTYWLISLNEENYNITKNLGFTIQGFNSFEKRKVSLSIKLLEEIQNKEAVNKFSSPLSGKNLPFSSLSDKLVKKNKK